jgi:hypothetical protein
MNDEILGLLDQLQDPDRTERMSAAAELACMEREAAPAIPILRQWIGSDDKYAHVTAAGAIIHIDNSEADLLIPLLIEALGFDGITQWQAVCQLESLGDLALPAVPALKRLANTGEATISWIASDALYQLTGDPSMIIDVGERLLQSSDELVRVVAVEHLMQLGDQSLPILATVAVEDESDLVRNRANSALKELKT